MYADEPHKFKIVGYCKYKRYTGPTAYRPRSMTEEQYFQFIENNTGCFHPEEYITIGGELEATDVSG